MSSTSRAPSGPLTEWAKSAGLISSGVSLAGRGLAATGKGVWNAAGHLAPNPLMRAGLIGASTVAVGSQVPQLAGRMSQDYHYANGTAPTTNRGF
jgi:hypothetical protein